jgi:hypothetical protein
MGTKVINLNDGDTVASVARLSAADMKLTEPDEKANGKETEITTETQEETVPGK